MNDGTTECQVSVDGCPKVLSLVGHPRNAGIPDALDEEYEVVSRKRLDQPLDELDVDLCLVDRSTFEASQSRLLAPERTTQSAKVPLLLVTEDGELPPEPPIRQHVDAVVEMPVDGDRLRWKVDRLLRVRELSLSATHNERRLQRFLSAAAHDIRNPLTLARGHLANLEGDADGETLGKIRSALTRMECIVDNVLSVHDPGRAVDVSVRESVDLRRAVRDCWDRLDPEAATLSVSVPDGVELHAAPGLLEQLLLVLLENAVEHGTADASVDQSPESGSANGTGTRSRADGYGDGSSSGSVTVQVGTLDDGDGFYVANSGCLPDVDSATVFEEGYGTGAGFGLGLSAADRICDAHDWRISVSERDGYTRFEVADVTVSRVPRSSEGD